MTETTASWTRHEDAAELSPSEKLVYLVIVEEAPLTQKEVIEQTRLPERTARAALGELRTRGIVTRQRSLRDARQHHYHLQTEEDVVTPEKTGDHETPADAD
jgi:DNA-binding MarR family transcriptional regulator